MTGFIGPNIFQVIWYFVSTPFRAIARFFKKGKKE